MYIGGMLWINNSADAIDRLGGTAKVARLFRKVSRSSVANRRKRGFPPQAYCVLAPHLVRRKLAFDRAQLFNMLEPNRGGQHGAGTQDAG